MAEYGLEDSKTQLKRISALLPKNKPVDLYQNLSGLSIALVMGVESYLRKFDSSVALPLLLEVAEQYMTHNDQGDIEVLTFRAVSLILEHVPSSYDDAQGLHKNFMRLASTAAHKALCEEWTYTDADNKLLLEECLRVMRFVGRDDPSGSMLRYALVGDLLTLCSWEDAIMSRMALETLVTLSSKVVLPTEIQKQTAPISGIFSIFRSSNKHKGSAADRSSSGSRHEGSSPPNADNPIVVIVENVLAPFLQSLVEQYVAAVEAVPEVWAMLELSLQCLCALMQRALLCCRAQTAHSLVSKELPAQIFRLIAYLQRNVSLEASVRADRLLLCETVLSVTMDCHRSLMLTVLLSKDAKNFFHAMLQGSDEEITTLLDDPFPRGGMAARSTQRRDKDHITSIAAVRLLLLACPNVPPEAFGPKPKTVLPVHEWLWEDELRHANRLVEEQALVLETAFTRLSHTTSITVHRKALSVDLQAMTMARGFQGGRRNIFRKFVPFVYHFADEQSLRPLHSVKEAGPDALEGTTKSSSSSSSKRKDDKHCILNTSVTVPEDHLALPEAYLDLLCHFATHASGQMARQLAVCTCAAMLQMFLISGAATRVKQQLRMRMVNICEMLREALISADKATKAVALTMIEWLLSHKMAEGCQFPITALRCGLVEQLDTLSKTTLVVAERESRQTRTAYLAEKSGTLSQIIFERLRLANGTSLAASCTTGGAGASTSSSKGSSSASRGRHSSQSGPPVALSPETSRLKQSVDALRSLGSQKGVHEGAIAQFFHALAGSSETTAYEFSQMGVASGVMMFLYNGRAMDSVLGHSMVYTSSASGSTVGRLSESMVGPTACPSVRVLEESPWTVMLTDGLHMAPLLRRAADAARLQRFVHEAVKSPKALQQLVSLLSSALAQQGDYPLVESLVTRDRVLCKTPLQAVATLTQVSPMVHLCGTDNGITDFNKAPTRAATSSPTRAGTSGATPQAAATAATTTTGAPNAADPSGETSLVTDSTGAKNPRNYCLQGHPLKHVAVYARPCTCDYCFKPVTRGYCCRLCNIDICSRCYPRYRGNPGLIASIVALDSAPKNRAHLMVSVGDIERYFRAGSSSTKGTFTAPTSQSSLTHLARFTEKVRLSLQRLVQAVQDEQSAPAEAAASAHKDPTDASSAKRRKRSGTDSDAASTSSARLFDPVEVSAARKLLSDDGLLQQCVYAILASHYTRGVMPGDPSGATAEGAAPASSSNSGVRAARALSPEEAAAADRMVRDSVDERYLLYRDAVGYCHYQESFLSLLYRKAFREGNTAVLMQLENCLVRLESSTDPITAASTASSPTAATASVAKARGSVTNDSVSHATGARSGGSRSTTQASAGATLSAASAGLIGSDEFDGNKLSGSQSFVFHHFAHDGAEKCVCGRFDRNHFSTCAHAALSFSAPVLSQRTDMQLLILLHDALVQNGTLRPSSAPAVPTTTTPRTPMGSSTLRAGQAGHHGANTDAGGMESWFVSTAVTNAVVKSLEASALRVSLLPMQFALPRWASFVLREARFLLPRAARERIARFLAYGARRSLITHMRIFRQYRDERQIGISHSEWARLSNHKFSIDRDRFIDDAFRTLCKASDARFAVSFEFKGDVGVGQGPTAQFYTRVATELSAVVRQLWRNTTVGEGSGSDQTTALVVPPPEGLYPRPGALNTPAHAMPTPPGGVTRRGFLASITDDGVGIISLADTTTPVCDYVQRQRALAKLFYLVGAAMGRAFLDEQVLPLQLSPALAYFLCSGYPPSYAEMEQFLFTSVAPEAERPIDLYDLPMRAVRMVDTSIADSLVALENMDAESLASLELPFTLPGHDSHELIPNGTAVLVDRTNLRQYQQRVITALLFDSVALPLRFLLRGCQDVLPGDALALLDPSELMPVLCGDAHDEKTPLWTLPEIKSVLVGDHGYQNDSPQLDMLARVLATRLTPIEQRSFLLFCTGCPRLPLGGIRALGAITVVRRSNAFVHAQHLLAAQERLKESAAGNGDDGDAPPPPDGLDAREEGLSEGAPSGTAAAASGSRTRPGERGSKSRPRHECPPAAVADTEEGSEVGRAGMAPVGLGSPSSPDAPAPLPGAAHGLSKMEGTNSSAHTDMPPQRTPSAASAARQPSAMGNDEAVDMNFLPESEWALPSVNTCFRYLKLPPYPSEDMLYNKLVLSITQSGEAFELS